MESSGMWNKHSITQWGRGLGIALTFFGMTGCSTSKEYVVSALLPRHFFYSQAEIQKKIAEKWHVDQKVLQLFEVKIDSPEISLQAEHNRLRGSFHLVIRRPFSSRPIEGRLRVAGKLRFDSPSRTIQLIQTQVEAIDAEGFSFQDPVLQTISDLFGGTLTDIPLYTLKPEDLNYAGVQFDPIHFTVKSDGVDVELEPRSKHL
jgi:Protein of unknown function (DUF1439)